MKRIGFCGLGIMGLPMAINLIKKLDTPIVGYDIVESKRIKIKEEGGISVDDVDEIYKNCDLIFLCLPSDELVRDSINRIVEIGRQGTIIVDLSSSSPYMIQELNRNVKKEKMSLLDCPVSGGEKGAKLGTLVLMCGGDLKTFEKVKDALLCIGKKVTYIGSSGSGDIAKIINNMIVGCNIASVSEGFSLAVKAGIDPEVLFNAIKDGFAGSEVLNLKIPKIIDRDFSASARVAIHQKDLIHAKQLADELKVEIPMSSHVLSLMNKVVAMGSEDEDHCAIVKVYENEMNVEIK